MTEKNNIIVNTKSLAERPPIQLREESVSKVEAVLYFDNNINNKISSQEIKKPNIKESSQSLKNSLNFSKAQTKSKFYEKRYDAFGILIEHGGKQKVSFIDRVTKNNLIEVIKVDNFKEYNKMEEVVPIYGNACNGCCILI